MAIRWTWSNLPLSQATAGLGPNATLAFAPGQGLDLDLRLPDLGAFPLPLEKARVLLESAGEVEHMLMVQYLYAAMTLKGPAAADLSDAQRTAVGSWRVTLTEIAVEEMGHLMGVQNLILFVGGQPSFEREEFPPRTDLYPFALHLEPLSFASLARYVLAESPLGDEDQLAEYRAVAGASDVRHVGIIYGLLDLLFRRPEEVPAAGTADAWDAFVARLADATGARHHPTEWHLPASAFDPASLARQAVPEDLPGDLYFAAVASPEQARDLLRRIGLQGEAPVTNPASHYRRFLEIARGSDDILAFPRDGSWVPAFAVGVDPTSAD